jgi:hypothetical protein
MPDMPLPVGRPPGLVAIERALNNVDDRLAIAAALAGWSRNEGESGLVEHVLDQLRATNHAEGLESALQAMVNAAAADDQRFNRVEGADPVMVGVRHLDDHWLSPVGQLGHWYNWDGDAAPIVQAGLLIALDAADDAPIHLVWTCGSPTFEVSVSAVDDPPVAVVVVISTPGTQADLVHIRPGEGASTVMEQGVGDDALVLEDQIVVHGLATRAGQVVTQDAEVYVAGAGDRAADQERQKRVVAAVERLRRPQPKLNRVERQQEAP